MKEYLKKLASFAVIILFVAAVFAAVTYAQKNTGNSTVTNSTVEGNCTPTETPVPTPVPTPIPVDTCNVNDTENSSVNSSLDNSSRSSSSELTCTNSTSNSENDTGIIDLRITALHPQASGSSEYFEVTNYGQYPVNLKGWILNEVHCGTSNTIEQSIPVMPNDTVRIYTKESKGNYSLGLAQHIFNSPSDNAWLSFTTPPAFK